ncbi:MAG: Uma2 family endonuclease [Pyrinomonadaceae bacterium]
MGLAKLKTKINVEDCLEGEKISREKHEYIDGEVYAMASTSDRHNRIVGNIFSKVDNHLEDSPCETFIESVKLRTNAQTFYYPDVMVACDKTPRSSYYREEPVLLVEIFSPTTERTDRNEKLSVYKNIPSLREYVIVWQDKIHVEIHRRQPDGRWITYFYNENDFGEQLEFQSVGLKITLEEIYRRVKFERQSSEVLQ